MSNHIKAVATATAAYGALVLFVGLIGVLLVVESVGAKTR